MKTEGNEAVTNSHMLKMLAHPPNNPAFKVVEFDHFKMQAGLHNFVLSVSEWINKTNAIGIIIKKASIESTQHPPSQTQNPSTKNY